MTIARCVGWKRRTLPAWMLGIVVGFWCYQPVHGQSFFDDFNDGNDQGWTHYDVLAPPAGHPSLAGSFTFPDGNSYRIQTPGNYNPPPLGNLQRGRVGSIVTGSNYSDFRITHDITDWNKDREYVFGPIARTAQPGLGTTDGYLLILNSDDNDFQLLRIENEVPHPDELGTVDVELIADTDFRIVYTGLGTQLNALVYDRANLSAPLGAFYVDAANYGPMPVPTPYTSGNVGLIVAQADDPDDVPVGAGPPYGATFDNYRTTVPTAGEWNALGGGKVSDKFNWVGNATPDGAGTHAKFLRGAEAEAVVDVDTSFYTLGRMTFDNPNRYKVTGMPMTLINAGDAEIDVLSGTHELNNMVTLGSKLVIEGAGTLVVSGELDWAGQTVELAGGRLRLTGASTNHSAASRLIIGANGAFELARPASASATLINPPTIAGNTGAWTGTFDLTNNDAVFQSSAATKTADFNRTYDQLKSGFDGGVWTGTGITSSTAATNPTADTGLSLVDNALLGATDFSGQTVNNDSLLLKYTYYGDIDLNGRVDGDDLTTFALNFGRTTGATQVDGDIDFNGRVDGEDLTVFANNFNKGIGNPLAAGAVAAVPEPASLVLAGLGGAGVLAGIAARHRKRKCV